MCNQVMRIRSNGIKTLCALHPCEQREVHFSVVNFSMLVTCPISSRFIDGGVCIMFTFQGRLQPPACRY